MIIILLRNGGIGHSAVVKPSSGSDPLVMGLFLPGYSKFFFCDCGLFDYPDVNMLAEVVKRT